MHTYCLDLFVNDYIDGLVQERRNSSALAMELRLSYTNPSTWSSDWVHVMYLPIFLSAASLDIGKIYRCSLTANRDTCV